MNPNNKMQIAKYLLSIKLLGKLQNQGLLHPEEQKDAEKYLRGFYQPKIV